MNAVSVPVNKVLVTGANGFIGRKLCNELARQGYSVVRAVRQTPLTNDENVEYTVVGDMDEPIDWMPVLSGVITVVHLMARVHKTQETSIQSIDKYRQTNVYATERLARDSAQAGVRRFVFVSSIKVNGEATKLNEQFSELDVPNPQGPYAVSKWEAEQILNQVACETGMEVVIVRPPMVYGPSVGGNFLRLMRLISWGIPLPLATINNQRSMIYLGNFVDALVVCANHPGAAGKTYLVSDGKDVST